MDCYMDYQDELSKREVYNLLDDYRKELLREPNPNMVLVSCLEIALEVLDDKIDEEESPCFNCDKEDCKFCIYNGRIS